MIRSIAEAAVSGLSPAELGYYALTGILGGGVWKFVDSLITARNMSKRTNVDTAAISAKLPAEVDSIAVQGAEAAVLTMKQALDSTAAQLATLDKSFAAFREETRRELDDTRRELAVEHDLRVKAVRRVEQITKVLVDNHMPVPSEEP